MDYTLQALNYKELPGLSEKQLAEHHDVLYAGYVKKTNEIRAALKEVDLTAANATFSQLRELKVEETFAVNGVKLHESYFDSMAATKNVGGSMLAGWIAADFGSMENWLAEFAACGLAARGWVVLAFDFKDGRLHNYMNDVHNQGGIWGAMPLIVLDVYEHAYFLDYATGRKKYIEAFMNNLNFAPADEIIKRFELEKFRS